MAQMTTDKLRDELLRALEEASGDHDIDIVDVEVVGSAKAPTVRVRIDHADEEAGPITLDEVSQETSWISDLVDELDPIEGHFTLEVSSPGLSRPLRRERDFVRFAGETVSLSTNATEGRRRYTGTLEGVVEGKVRIATDEGSFEFEISSIRTCTIKPNFDSLGKSNKSGNNRKGKR